MNGRNIDGIHARISKRNTGKRALVEEHEEPKCSTRSRSGG
jgi:hypothetical protein